MSRFASNSTGDMTYNEFNFIQSIIAMDSGDIYEKILSITRNLVFSSSLGLYVYPCSKNSSGYWLCDHNESNEFTETAFRLSSDFSEGISELVRTTEDVVSRVSVSDNGPFISYESPTKDFFKNIICCALRWNGETFGILCAKRVKSSKSEEFSTFTNDEIKFFRQICSNGSLAIFKRVESNRLLREGKRSEALLSIVRARAADESLDLILQVTINACYNLLESERVSVFLCDQNNQEAWIVASKDPQLIGLTIPFGTGIAGTVAMTGETIRVEDAQSDPRLFQAVDSKTGFRTKTMICAGIPGFSDHDKPIGLIQVINKLDGTVYDEFDEESLTVFCTEMTMTLRRRVLELNLLRVERSSTISITNRAKQNKITRHSKSRQSMAFNAGLELSLLEEYGIENPKRFSILPSPNGNFEEKALKRVGSPRRFSINTTHRMITTWDLNPFDYSDAELVNLAEQIFLDFDCLSEFQIAHFYIKDFVDKIRLTYYHKNSFHNFRHVWSVFHVASMMIREGAIRYLSSVDVLAVLVTALCHDMGHTGNNNAFEVASFSPIAIKYSFDSVLERHHSSLAMAALHDARADLLADMKQSDYMELCKIVHQAILGTDMAQHFKHVQLLESKLNVSPPFTDEFSSRVELVSSLVHCADLSGQTQKHDLAMMWGNLCAAEFTHQAEEEMKLGLAQTPFMIGLDDEKQLMVLQLGFINNIVLPLWSAYSSHFPEMKFAVENLIANRDYYDNRIDELEEAEMGARAMDALNDDDDDI